MSPGVLMMTLRSERSCGSSPRTGRGGGIAGRIITSASRAHDVNRKRVGRLWREEGLRVPQHKRKRRRLGDSTSPDRRMVAERPNHVWTFDFQSDQTADGRVLRFCNIVDEFTREALVMHVARSIDADTVVALLEGLVAERGAPGHLRMEGGPEMTAHALQKWCESAGTQTVYIDPGSPWQNPYVESFHSRVRDELLDIEEFSCLAEARVLTEDWREDYNHRRPHSSLGMLTPVAFAAGHGITPAVLGPLADPEPAEKLTA